MIALAKANAKLLGQFTDWSAEFIDKIFIKTSSKYLIHCSTVQFWHGFSPKTLNSNLSILSTNSEF